VCFVPQDNGGGIQDRHTAAAEGKIDGELTYFYHLREGKVSEFWLQANVDFDYKARPRTLRLWEPLPSIPDVG
jgi:hypothetical protein